MSDSEVLAKKSKTEDNHTNGGNPATCAHWVIRKKRYCKMLVSGGKRFCGEHEPVDTKQSSEGESNDGRIPCPLDGKHTVYKKNLYKHLKICNARTKSDEPPYIEKGINAGDSEIDIDNHNSIRLSDLDDIEFFKVIDKVKKLYAQYELGNIDTLNIKHESVNEDLKDVEKGKNAEKHLLQTSALLGIFEIEEQFKSSSCFIEFGAGKGQLAYHLAKVLQSRKECSESRIILLDRKSLRHKKDNKIDDKDIIQRIRVDIADFNLNKFELPSVSKRIVAFSKHLCGAATDLTLRCLINYSLTDFVMIALCCHHRCEWSSYVGKEFFQSNDISSRQFVIITKMVSWAVCGNGMSRERRQMLQNNSLVTCEDKDKTDQVAQQRLPLAEREEIGIMCKRLLDYARLEYLRQHGFEADIKYYVPRNITLENVCMIAKKLTKAS